LSLVLYLCVFLGGGSDDDDEQVDVQGAQAKNKPQLFAARAAFLDYKDKAFRTKCDEVADLIEASGCIDLTDAVWCVSVFSE
jgi:hypothetical protein